MYGIHLAPSSVILGRRDKVKFKVKFTRSSRLASSEIRICRPKMNTLCPSKDTVKSKAYGWTDSHRDRQSNTHTHTRGSKIRTSYSCWVWGQGMRQCEAYVGLCCLKTFSSQMNVDGQIVTQTDTRTDGPKIICTRFSSWVLGKDIR